MAKNNCCHAFVYKKVDLEQKKRKVCKRCGFIDYGNPKLVSGSLVLKNNKFLLCKRAIEPSYGKWTFPSGYVDEGETPEEGAIREAKEEANIKIRIKSLLAVFTIKKKNLIQFIFLANEVNSKAKPGIETLDLKYFSFTEIPWRELAFPSVALILKKNIKKPLKKTFFFTFNND